MELQRPLPNKNFLLLYCLVFFDYFFLTLFVVVLFLLMLDLYIEKIVLGIVWSVFDIFSLGSCWVFLISDQLA